MMLGGGFFICEVAGIWLWGMYFGFKGLLV